MEKYKSKIFRYISFLLCLIMVMSFQLSAYGTATNGNSIGNLKNDGLIAYNNGWSY